MTNVLVGMSSPAPEFADRLAEVGKIQARRYFMEGDLTDTDGPRVVASEATAGRVVVLSSKLAGSTWADVAAGKRDTDLRALLESINTGCAPVGRVFFTIHHEPAKAGGTAGENGTPAQHAAMMVHLADVAKDYPHVLVGPIMNGYLFSPGRMGVPDSVINAWLTPAVRAVVDFIAADTYQTDNDTVLARMKGLEAWANRNAYGGPLGVGEFGCLTAPDLTAVTDYALSSDRWAFLLNFNSNRNNREGRYWQLVGDILDAFEAAVAKAVALAAAPPPDPRDAQIAALNAKMTDLLTQVDMLQQTLAQETAAAAAAEGRAQTAEQLAAGLATQIKTAAQAVNAAAAALA